MPVMQPPDDRGVDWTGGFPDDSPIAPLDGRTFVERLQRLSERARDLTLLRRARTESARTPHREQAESASGAAEVGLEGAFHVVVDARDEEDREDGEDERHGDADVEVLHEVDPWRQESVVKPRVAPRAAVSIAASGLYKARGASIFPICE